MHAAAARLVAHRCWLPAERVAVTTTHLGRHGEGPRAAASLAGGSAACPRSRDAPAAAHAAAVSSRGPLACASADAAVAATEHRAAVRAATSHSCCCGLGRRLHDASRHVPSAACAADEAAAANALLPCCCCCCCFPRLAAAAGQHGRCISPAAGCCYELRSAQRVERQLPPRRAASGCCLLLPAALNVGCQVRLFLQDLRSRGGLRAATHRHKQSSSALEGALSAC